ncbi:MAG: Uma2 family endonuclease [Planctomycetia bacterium]|nr:Uma2 family endonuclease [Planctomycetia bacterium]
MSSNVAEIVYPESDGKPMADNTLQWDWMVKIVGELREMFAGQEVFVAGDLFWYPVQGSPNIVTAPDGLVAFGRPHGYRGSYKQWEEDNIAPQVVFEVLSPNNTYGEMDEKRAFYEKYGVEEYYFIDPYENEVEIYLRRGKRLIKQDDVFGIESPRLKIRFAKKDDELVILAPDGRTFQTREERVEEMLDEIEESRRLIQEERSRATDAVITAELERRKADEERRKADEECAAKERLAAKLRELGVNPDDIIRGS